MSIKNKILKLKSEGLNNAEITMQVGCNRSTVDYHCNPNGKTNRNKAIKKFRKKTNYNKNYYKQHPSGPLLHKLRRFINRKQKSLKRKNLSLTNEQIYNKLRHFHKRGIYSMTAIPTLDEVKNKIGENPKCYLTGEQIDLSQPKTYQFDHIIPTSRGGDNSLNNLGICTKLANRAKTDMTPEELIDFCKKVLIHHGYIISS